MVFAALRRPPPPSAAPAAARTAQRDRRPDKKLLLNSASPARCLSVRIDDRLFVCIAALQARAPNKHFLW